MGHFLTLCVVMITVAACSGVKSAKIQPMKAEDKQLACADILLEMNEAEFFKRKAKENRGLSMRNVLLPHTYPSTLISAQDAIGTADNRIQYLQKIYDIRQCEKAEKFVEQRLKQQPDPQRVAYPVPPQAFMPQTYYQPMPQMMMPPAMMPYGYAPQMMAPTYQPQAYVSPPPTYGLDYRPDMSAQQPM